MKKKTVTTLLKLSVVVLCLAILSRKLNLGDIGHNLSHVRLPYLLPALAMILCEPFIMAGKWDLLLRQKAVHAGYFTIVRLIFISNFVAVVFPTALAADAIRIYFLKQRNHSLTHATATLVADRLMALTTLVLLSLIGLPVAWGYIADKRVLLVVILASGLLLAAILLLFSEVPLAICRTVRNRFSAGSAGKFAATIRRAAEFAENTHASARSLTEAPRLLSAVFLLNIAVQVLRTLQIHFIFRALGAPVPLFQEFVFVPMIIMLALLPISYFGMGVKEGAFAFFFSSVNVPAAVSVSVSLITYPLIALGLLPGAFFFAVQPKRSSGEPSPEESAR